MAGIKFSFPTVTKKIIVKWSKNSTPLIEAGRSAAFAPSSEPHVLVPTGLQNVAYTFEFWTTDDEVTLLSKVASWSIHGTLLNSAKAQVEFFHYFIGSGDSGEGWTTPNAGESELSDARLAGKDCALIMSVSGPRSDVSWKAEGGFTFNNPEEYFNEGTTLLIIATSTGDVDDELAAGATDNIRIVTTGGDITPVFFNAHNVAKFTGLKTVHTFPAFDTIPAGTRMRFSTHNFTQDNRYWKLQFIGDDTVYLRGAERSKILLGACQEIELFFYDEGGFIKALLTVGGKIYDQVGESINSNFKDLANTIWGDGQTEYNTDDLERPFEVLTPDQKVTYAQWNTSVYVGATGESLNVVERTAYLAAGKVVLQKYPNKSKWAVDTATGKCYPPDRRGQTQKVLASYTDSVASMASQGPGGREFEMVLKHGHTGVPEEKDDTDRGLGGSSKFSLDTKGETDQSGGAHNLIDSEGVYGLIGI